MTHAPERIRAAIEKIATRSVNMEVAVHTLLVEGGDTNRRQAAAANPRGTSTTVAKTAKQLANVTKRAKELRLALETLNAPAAGAFRNLDTVIHSVRSVEIVADAGPSALPKGDFNKAAAHTPRERLALAAAFVFFEATGKKPTISNGVDSRERRRPASGPFIPFLEAVFAARGFHRATTVEHDARTAISNMEQSRAN